ncbi:hypothetical protein Pcac1_g9402 [Phytophthora cactorum]|nr:hypothetical protein Pcac1_g9402 [Phytophthora cactorum]
MTINMFNPGNVGGSNIQEGRRFMRADDGVESASVFSGAHGLSPDIDVFRHRDDSETKTNVTM